MRERARDKGRLEDIIEYSSNVTNLIEGYSLEALVADKRTYYSVMKNVEVVGEAAYMRIRRCQQGGHRKGCTQHESRRFERGKDCEVHWPDSRRNRRTIMVEKQRAGSRGRRMSAWLPALVLFPIKL